MQKSTTTDPPKRIAFSRENHCIWVIFELCRRVRVTFPNKRGYESIKIQYICGFVPVKIDFLQCFYLMLSVRIYRILLKMPPASLYIYLQTKCIANTNSYKLIMRHDKTFCFKHINK